VPRPGARGEDDGWLLTYVHDQGAGKSELVVLDAKEIERAPLARVLLPRRIPFGFHGTWLGESAWKGS
jgi:carotenoid cleavage dioxygenase